MSGAGLSSPRFLPTQNSASSISISGAKQDAEETDKWVGGMILDPAKGSSYKLILKTTDGGKKLDVRGYIGSPMFGRTQTWIRVE